MSFAFLKQKGGGFVLKIAVCDDEKYFRMKIKSIILKYMTTRNYDCVVDCYKSGEEIFVCE